MAPVVSSMLAAVVPPILPLATSGTAIAVMGSVIVGALVMLAWLLRRDAREPEDDEPGGGGGSSQEH